MATLVSASSRFEQAQGEDDWKVSRKLQSHVLRNRGGD